jgi:DNA topoisomerase-3
VDRHDEILTFTPEPFWVVEVELGKDGRTVCLEWDRGRLFDHETACLFETIVKEGTHVSVTSVKESETSRPRPTALNTVEMLKIASRALGMGPAQAMSAAERLYLSGYMSYPRTESTQYHDSFDLEGTVSEQCRSPYWGSYAATLLATGLQRPKKGVDAGDHPPITPVRSAAPGELVGDMERLYDMITRHFLATGMCWPVECAVFYALNSSLYFVQ